MYVSKNNTNKSSQNSSPAFLRSLGEQYAGSLMKLTPEVFLEAPHRLPGVPNSTGTLILHQLCVIDLATGLSRVVAELDRARNFDWFTDRQIALLRAADGGGTTLLILNVDEAKPNETEICLIAGSFSKVKLKRLSEDHVVLVCVATTTPIGKMEISDPDVKTALYSTAKTYTKLFARRLASWASDKFPSIWYGLLQRSAISGANDSATGTGWELRDPGLVHLLDGSRVCKDFDVGPHGIVFVAQDPDLCPATFTKTDPYFVAIDFRALAASPGPCLSHAPQRIHTGNLQGYTNSPVFSPDGRSIALTRMRSQQNERDKRRLLVVPEIGDLSSIREVHWTEDGVGLWDCTPMDIFWSNDGTQLYVRAEHQSAGMLWRLSSSPLPTTQLPEPIFSQGYVLGASPLPDGTLFVSHSSLTESSCFSTIDPDVGSSSHRVVSSVSGGGQAFGLSRTQVSDFWFLGATGYPVHALVIRPSDYDEAATQSKRYPLAMLIHGGPKQSWSDKWDKKYNPAVFAEQGYLVVMPNITGSIGYGVAHCDAVTENWGGTPYEDIVNCFDYVEKNIAHADVDNAVAIGSSYGGYMINWIQGHELGRRFKALVCYCGTFSTLSRWSTDELFFLIHEFGGTPWEARETWEKWDPSRYADKWATPELIVHGERDFRVSITEGLAAFNTLQRKGVPSRFLVFPDEGHGVNKPENLLEFYREVFAWINKYSGITLSSEGAHSTGTRADGEDVPERLRNLTL